jgi:hypothetical protein
MSNIAAMEDGRANQRARAERKSLDRIVASMMERFPRTSRSAIQRIVDRRYLEFSGAPIRDYIPIMVEREAREDLRAVIITELQEIRRAQFAVTAK